MVWETDSTSYERNSKVTLQRHIFIGRGIIGAIFTINLSHMPSLLESEVLNNRDFVPFMSLSLGDRPGLGIEKASIMSFQMNE